MLASVLAGLVGGVGLFLLGMELMTSGLRLAAGPALERLLAASTRTRWRGLLAGLGVTALVQSSSAVTVAVIGFVNAGLLSFSQSLWVVFGANVGTTMTGWIVAVLGFGVKIDALALPLVGLGVALRMSGAGLRRGALGTALAGFGLLFIGIEVLKDAFDGVAQGVTLPAGSGAGAVLMQLLVGVLMTVLMQSSSAALTLVLSAAQSGLLTVQGAAAVVIGTNIGTTVTAAIAAAGATANARRAAAAHVLFNLITGAVALVLLPWLVPALLAFKAWLGLPPSPALTVALFHTLFNVLGVALMWPLADRLAAWLQRRFHTAEEDEARPRFLDDTVLAVPVLALDALQAEIARLRALSVRALRRALGAAVPPAGAAPVRSLEDAQAQAAREHTVAHALQRAVADFVVRLQRAEMSADSAARLPVLLRVARYAEVATAQAEESVAASLRADAALATTVALTPLEQAFAGAVQELLSALDALGAAAAPDDGPGGGPAGGPVEPRLRRVADALAEVEHHYAQLKAALLRRGAEGQLAIEAMQERLDALSALRRGLQQAVKAVQWAHGAAAPAADDAAG